MGGAGPEGGDVPAEVPGEGGAEGVVGVGPLVGEGDGDGTILEATNSWRFVTRDLMEINSVKTFSISESVTVQFWH